MRPPCADLSDGWVPGGAGGPRRAPGPEPEPDPNDIVISFTPVDALYQAPAHRAAAHRAAYTSYEPIHCRGSIYCSSGETMAEAEPLLLRVDQAEPRYNEALQTAVAACAADTVGQTCYICLGPGDEEEGLVRGCSCRGGAGCAHVSCLARQAEVAVERGSGPGWERWHTCGLCEQHYHGVVGCALGWACWKTYMGRPEMDSLRKSAVGLLAGGLYNAKHWEAALSVREAQLSMRRRDGASEDRILTVQSQIANTYDALGLDQESHQMSRDVYSISIKLYGEEHEDTLMGALSYATSLLRLERFIEAQSLLLKAMPVAQRVVGENHELTHRMRFTYAVVLYRDPGATLEDLRSAVTTLEDIEGIARRVYGVTHPLTGRVEHHLGNARTLLRAREEAPGDVSSVCDQMAAMTPPGDS